MKSSARTLPRPRLPKAPGGPAPASVGRLPRQRRPLWIIGAAILVLIAVVANVQLVQASGHRVPVVLLARDVPMGHKITQTDLAVTRVAAEPAVVTVPGRQLGEVVGRRAAVSLRKGSLLAPRQLTAQTSPQRGEALVSIPLKSNLMPPHLTAGWKVRVVFTSSDQDREAADATAQDRRIINPRNVSAVVDEVNGPDAEGSMTVSLLVADSDSSTVARQAAAGLVVLVVTERQG